MRILQVITLYLPDFVGGASILCQNIADELKKNNEVKIFCGYIKDGEEPYSIKNYEHNGVAVRGINASPFYDFNKVENYYNPRVNKIFREFLAEFSPDIIHFHSIQALGAQLIDVAVDMGIPFVITMHDWWWICNDMFLATRDGKRCPDIVNIDKCDCMPTDFLRRRNAYLRSIVKKADFVLATSNYLRKSLIDNGFPQESITVNENGLLKELHPKPKNASGKVIFSYLGGCWRHKGVHTIVDALIRIGASDKYEARLYGANNYLRDNGINAHSSMKTPSKFDNAELVNVLSETDILVVPSVMRESFSLVTREAFLCDVPVICSDCGGAEEVVTDGVNGFVFKTNDSAELAEKMSFLIKHPQEIPKLKKNIDKSKILSIKEQGAHLVEIYAKAVKPKKEKFRPAYEKDCDITDKKDWINSELHTCVVRNADNMPIYLDQPFLYAVDNMQSSKVSVELNSLFPLENGESEQVIKTLCDLKLIKKSS